MLHIVEGKDAKTIEDIKDYLALPCSYE